MDKLRQNWLRLSLSLAITAAFIIYIFVNRHSIFGALSHLNGWYLLPVFAGEIGVQLSNAALLKATVRPLGKQLGFWESTRLTTVSSFVNFFTPVVGGASVRAVYLKRRHELSLPAFVSVTYANYLIIFIVSFAAGLVALAKLHGFGHKAGAVVALFFAGGILFSLGFMAFGHRLTGYLVKRNYKSRLANKIIKQLALFDEGWGTIRRDGRTMAAMTFWSAATLACVALVYWAAMRSIGLPASVDVAVVFAALAIVGLLFNITPGSVGIREAVYFAIASITAVTAQQVVAFSLVDRSAQLITIGVGWLLFNRQIIHSVTKSKD